MRNKVPGNPDGEITDKLILHPRLDEINDFADTIQAEIQDLLEALYGTEKLKERTEMIVEVIADALAEWLPS
jgi:hypothetical protein